MFRDSRGVVHTVAAPDPLDDLPEGAARALQQALLQPAGSDLGGALERCEAVRVLLDAWQDAFFAALPEELDLQEEARWAAEAGLSLADVEAQYDEQDDLEDDLDEDFEDDLDSDLGSDLAADLDGDLTGDLDGGLGPGSGPSWPGAGLDLPAAGPADPDDPRLLLGEDLVQVLERELLLLPLRVRLEALVAAGELVGAWADLLADPEKLLGHLVLAHRAVPQAHAHEALADAHAAAHATTGPGHGSGQSGSPAPVDRP